MSRVRLATPRGKAPRGHVDAWMLLASISNRHAPTVLSQDLKPIPSTCAAETAQEVGDCTTRAATPRRRQEPAQPRCLKISAMGTSARSHVGHALAAGARRCSGEAHRVPFLGMLSIAVAAAGGAGHDQGCRPEARSPRTMSRPRSSRPPTSRFLGLSSSTPGFGRHAWRADILQGITIPTATCCVFARCGQMR